MDSNGHHSGAARESSVVTKYTREFRINEKNNTEKRCKARGQYMYHPQVKTLRLFFLFLWLQFIVSIAVWNHYIFLLNTGFYQFEDISSLQVINRMFFLQIVGRFVGPLFFLLFIMKSCQRSKKTESVNRLKAFSVILVCMGAIEFVMWKTNGISSENRIQFLCSSIYPTAFFAAYCFFTPARDKTFMRVVYIGTVCTIAICTLPTLSLSLELYNEKIYWDYHLCYIVYPIFLTLYA